jgi:hypothetical protein
MSGDVRRSQSLNETPAAVFPGMLGSLAESALPSWGARRFISILAILMAASLSGWAQTITVTVAGAAPKEWNVGSFDLANLISPPAGNDFTSTQTGPNPTVTMDTTSPGNSAHDVTITRAADTTWNSTYTLWVYPGSSGTGAGSLTWNITTWTQVPTSPTTLTLFTVRRNRTGITILLELRALTVAAGTTASSPSFLTTLGYTIN